MGRWVPRESLVPGVIRDSALVGYTAEMLKRFVAGSASTEDMHSGGWAPKGASPKITMSACVTPEPRSGKDFNAEPPCASRSVEL